MTETMSSQERAKQTRDRIAGEVKSKNDEIALQDQTAKDALAIFNSNPELASFLNEFSKRGSENVQQESMPTLKIHVANKSTGNILSDGSEPKDGWFFYTKTKQQFENPIIHILSVSKEFYTKPVQEYKNGVKNKPVYNQILSGVILNENEYLPFIMYFSTNKLSNLWDFMKIVQPYTHRKPVSIPMFALTVKLKSSKKKVEYEESGIKKTTFASVVDFELLMDGNFPLVTTDMGELIFLKDLLNKTEDTVNNIIESKNVGKNFELLNGNNFENVAVDGEKENTDEEIVIHDDMENDEGGGRREYPPF